MFCWAIEWKRAAIKKKKKHTTNACVDRSDLHCNRPIHALPFSLHHDGVIKWNQFPRYWPFVREIHRSPVNSLHIGQWRGALMFSFICALNKRLSTQSWAWWFEMPSRSLWRHCNDIRVWLYSLIKQTFWLFFPQLCCYYNFISWQFGCNEYNVSHCMDFKSGIYVLWWRMELHWNDNFGLNLYLYRRKMSKNHSFSSNWKICI